MNEDRFKFRAWDIKKKKMIYSYSVINGNWHVHPHYQYYQSYYGEGPNLIHMQCTGLKDKNWNLMFEGDIIKNYSTEYAIAYEDAVTSQIRFDEVNARFYLHPIIHEFHEFFERVCEVIGNIYENPELLKGADND